MPELPEVETIRRQLAPHMEGRVLESLEVLDPRWCEPAPPERGRRRGAAGGGSRRWAGAASTSMVALEDEVHLVMHLRMTGNLLLVPEADDAGPPPPARAARRSDDGSGVLFVDQRRFGTGRRAAGHADARDEYFDVAARASSRWARTSPPRPCARWRAGAGRRSRRSC